MPIQKCQTKGKVGYKYGDAGKCYAGGKEAKKKAIKQGLAIAQRQGRKPHL